MRIRLNPPVTAISGTLKGAGISFAHRLGSQMSHYPYRHFPIRTPFRREAWDWLFRQINQHRRHIPEHFRRLWAEFAAELSRQQPGTTHRMPWWAAYMIVHVMRLTQGLDYTDVPPQERPEFFYTRMDACYYKMAQHRFDYALRWDGTLGANSKVLIRIWQGSLSGQRHARQSDLRWISGPTPESIKPALQNWETTRIEDGVFRFTQTVWQTIELQAISSDFWPGTVSQFHRQQIAVA